MVRSRRRPHEGPRLSPPVAVLAAMVALYVAVFGTLTWRQQSRFGTFGFDLGIYDQGIWLLSRFRDPFVTVRGLEYFGHHVNPITVVLMPFYWLGAGPHLLLVVQTIWMAVGALPLWLLARDRLGDEWSATGIAAAFLLYPSLEWINWWHFHPDALIITPLLFAWWLTLRRRWGWFAVAAGVTLACKEDAALAVLVLGLVVAWRERHQRRGRAVGLVSAAVGAVWFLVSTKVILPGANGLGAFYESLFPGFGTTSNEIAANMALHPGRVLRLATERSRLTYYWQLLAPVALLALGGLPVLLVAAPQVLINVVSDHPYTHQIRYHYSAIVVAAVFMATVESCARLSRTRFRPRTLVVVTVAAALATNVAWSPSPMGRDSGRGYWAKPSPRHAAMREAVAQVPADGAVTATYQLVPHLTHRILVYEWPNPWVVTNWGVRGENPGDPGRVGWLVVDLTLLGQERNLFDGLTAPGGQFRVVFERDQVVVAQRRAG